MQAHFVARHVYASMGVCAIVALVRRGTSVASDVGTRLSIATTAYHSRLKCCCALSSALEGLRVYVAVVCCWLII
jgi:hypothetical protein